MIPRSLSYVAVGVRDMDRIELQEMLPPYSGLRLCATSVGVILVIAHASSRNPQGEDQLRPY
jgi:hypothetical protein